MDITRVIGELRQELAQLERCIVELENLRQIQGSRICKWRTGSSPAPSGSWSRPNAVGLS